MESFSSFENAPEASSVDATPAENPRPSVRERLERVGLRPTLQRLDLGEQIFERGNWHFTAEMLYARTRSLRYPPSMATIYNTLAQFSKSGLLREVALYDAKLWYCTKTGPHYHFYLEDTDELFDIPKHLEPSLNIPAPDGMHVTTVDVIVRLKRA